MRPFQAIILALIIFVSCSPKKEESSELILTEESWSTPSDTEKVLSESITGNQAVLSEVSSSSFDKIRSLEYDTFRAQLPVGETFQEYTFSPFDILSDSLKKQFPEIRFYEGRSIAQPSITALLSLSSEKASFRLENGMKNLMEMRNNRNVFEMVEAREQQFSFKEQILDQQNRLKISAPRKTSNTNTNTNVQHVKVIKVAISATGEYTAEFGSSYLAWLEALEVVGHVSQIFNRELGVRLSVVSGPTTIYNDSINDPFDNYDIDQCFAVNQKLLDSIYGNSAYDLGHIFTTDTAGGAAKLNGILRNDLKAMGASGVPNPFGNNFSVDFVAHEMGHQLGAEHIFNGARCPIDTHNKYNSFEPGSGSSIMSYAGLCGEDDLQSHPDPYFNNISFAQIKSILNQATFLDSFQTSNHYPEAWVDTTIYTIPAQTPFRLTGEGFDQDNDILRYSWEQIDIDTTRALFIDEQTKLSPLFRSFNYSHDNFRDFPSFWSLLDQNISLGELLPEHKRTMKFSFTVRDLRGGVSYADVAVDVDDQSDPFHLIFPNQFESIVAGDTATIRWNVGQTNQSPINCQLVNILLSVDGGANFDSLAYDVPNNGEALVRFPSVSTSRARILVEASDNIFFNVSQNDFEIR